MHRENFPIPNTGLGMNSKLFNEALPHLNQKIGEDKRVLSGAFWGELRIFLAVAKHQSFNGAAQALGMSQPTVSRQVKWLQDRLGAQLLVHSKRGIRLTPRGIILANILNRLDVQLFELAHELKLERSDAEGLIRISVTEALAGLFVVPQIKALKASNPRLSLHISNPTNMNSLSENHTDILVNFSPETSATVQSRRVGTAHLIPIATKEYISKNGFPKNSTIEDHHFIQSSYYMGDSPIWARWKDTVEQARYVDFCDNSFAYGLMVKSPLVLVYLEITHWQTWMQLRLTLVFILNYYILACSAIQAGCKTSADCLRLAGRNFQRASPWFADEFKPAALPTDLLAPVIAKLISRG